ncbi:MAG: hypothetical protein QME71_10550 [Dehalococcoidia bacterium]|nr:hypothetical protein [Dehalococcoidia bacterium]
MLRPLMRRLRQQSMDSRVREALEAGIGLYHNHWDLKGQEQGGLRPEEAGRTALEWCRHTMARMRRPYGLDYVTFALALLDENNQELARMSFGVLRPADFYNEGAAVQRIDQAVRAWLTAGHFERASDLSAVIFSWGDITRELLLAG